MPAAAAPDTQWATNWLEAVAHNPAAMSQRKLSSIEKHGGLAHARAVAQEKGVHLLLLEDDHGTALVAASTRPFTVVC